MVIKKFTSSQCPVNPTLATPILVLFHLSFVKKWFHSYGYATIFCLVQIKNNGDLSHKLGVTRP